MTIFRRPKKNKEKEIKQRQIAGRLFLVGSNFIAGVAVLGYLGYLLDKRLGYEDRYMVVGASLGIIWAVYEAIKMACWVSREDDDGKDKDGDTENE